MRTNRRIGLQYDTASTKRIQPIALSNVANAPSLMLQVGRNENHFFNFSVFPLIADSSTKQHYVDYDNREVQPAFYGDTFDWQNKGAIDFIEYLKRMPQREDLGEVSIQGVHYGWIDEEDVYSLISLLDSKEPCTGVKMAASSYRNYQTSTVGHEAAYLIQGFKNGRHPYLLNSSKLNLDKKESYRLRQWCVRFMKYFKEKHSQTGDDNSE